MNEETMNTNPSSENKENWWDTTLPITLSAVLSFVLIVLIVIVIVQCCQKLRVNRRKNPKPAKPPKEKKPKKEELLQEKSVQDVESGAPRSENKSFLVSGKRLHSTRKGENKSWYDSKVIPFIDDGNAASLDNLYLPDAVQNEYK